MMKIAVLVREVPDVVEELVIAEDGQSLSEDDIMYIPSEADEHALEEALLLKARHDASITAVGLGGDEARDALANAMAKGADGAALLAVPFEHRGDNQWLASALRPELASGGYDLILTGASAADQMDAGLPGLLAAHLSLPFLGGITAVAIDPARRKGTVRKEFPGGRLGVLEAPLPCVLGILSAEQPPRYVPVSKVMQARKTLQVREVPQPPGLAAGVRPTKLMKAASATRAEMFPGDANQVAEHIVRLLRERGLA